jgi:hypothetical protein
MTAASMAAGSPVFGTPSTSANPVVKPLSILIGRPDIGAPTLGQIQRPKGGDLTVGSPDYGTDLPAPVLFAFDEKPAVVCLTDRDNPTLDGVSVFVTLSPPGGM